MNQGFCAKMEISYGWASVDLHHRNPNKGQCATPPKLSNLLLLFICLCSSLLQFTDYFTFRGFLIHTKQMTLCSRKQVWKEIEKPMEVERKIVSLEALYIVYDADGTVAGELLYLLRKWLGKGHCAACDITHGPRKVKPEWTILQKTGWLGVPLFNIHRDEMEPKLRSAVSCALPCVAALVDNGDYVLLLQPEDLESCKGQVSKLQEKIVEALKDFGFQVNESFTSVVTSDLSDTCPSTLDREKEEDDAVVPF
ncbi:uncharacterized protein Gasu_46970 [Galdieria sulphuraria]|uniref:Uncharacterized protein n=1 Tax=Galdieria sulphuraria TaxID=130081 RepID=M2XCN2_GALSU|nr:uncharacterized protein Gasu_46970 [Galdieria sulphuraria]EME27707.1 hypothetical protein Gasu_46970 [Galdieria sulphuraria]|eukprot:XP_005704227.1 hypothetical protein Gasu_46970 [Galdieria sulphuraria]